ncbi:complex I NDUFA9 subunit family protein [Sulfobacillus thermosulfidooxidans]|uniref:complex I NDUFA9 subunit family protein n=1 Tax=Sulfobacillus thermosulfidooxidans TaxID=28034 RepID=UPI0006B45C62|nr:complex I NDUFA9 subunit family protein [Sulfobacillus thermosulfidooxidans]
MRVFVTGGTGYVGQAVQQALLRHHHEISVLARHPSNLAVGAHFVAGDIRQVELTSVMQGFDVVIHLVGIIEEQRTKGITFDVMHYQVTKRLVDAMKHNGLPRLIHISALGTRENAPSRYHQSKWKAEQYIRQQGVNAIILRPSLLFGGGAPFFQMLKTQCHWPVVPIPGNGDTLLQPVARQDVAELIARLVDLPQYGGETWEVGGPTVFTLNDLYRHVAKTIGRKHLPLFHVPLPLLFAAARLGQNLPGFPVTVDQLFMLNEPNITEDTRWHQIIAHPTPLGTDF